ncbi:MAG: hypothetical protein Q9220_007427 [cf. Caloplaca sp. 1 TL-2023]
MALLSAAFPDLASDAVQLYFTKDSLLENLPFLVFYGPSTTSNATRSSTRIQAHVYSLAGFQSFPRLTIAPTSPLYAAVNHLPADKQGDEVCRGLAVSLLSYFAGLSKPVKDVLRELAGRRRPNRLAPAMFDEMHAGDLASSMIKIDSAGETMRTLSAALPQQSISWADIDVILPPKTIQRAVSQEGADLVPSFGDEGLPLFRFGQYSGLIEHFGQPAFLPTSKLRRAPSRPTAHSKAGSLSKDQKVTLRREMCEMLDTEKNYVAKLKSLVGEIAADFRQSVQQDTQSRGFRLSTDLADRLFPDCLTRILRVNEGFLVELEDVLSATEDEAIRDIESLAGQPVESQLGYVKNDAYKRDPTGTLGFAKTLLNWLPKFAVPYQEYMRINANLTEALASARDDSQSALSQTLNSFGEQRLRSLLIEPVQRLPRYSLLLDNIISQLPSAHSAMTSLLKSKDILADICALENGTSAGSTRASSILRRFVQNWPSWLSPRGRLIAAIDAVQMKAPYGDSSFGQDVILLLFADSLIVAQRLSGNSPTAKGILAEMDRNMTISTREVAEDVGLYFSAAVDLLKIRISESSDHRLLRVNHTVASSSQFQTFREMQRAIEVDVKVFLLLGPYEGKTQRLSGEIAKARIEGRFPEAIRESDKWALRMIETTPGSMNLIAAIYEHQDANKGNAVQSSSRIRVKIDADANAFHELMSMDSSTEAAVLITPLGSDAFKLDMKGLEGAQYSETSAIENLSRVLVRNVMQMLNAQAHGRTYSSASSLVAFNREVLRTLSISRPDDGSQNRSSRPLSPIKMVANLLGAAVNQIDTPSKRREQAPSMREIPPLPPPKPSGQPREIQASRLSGDQVTLINASEKGTEDPFTGLEHTFNAYMMALQSRSGNVVGRILRNRATADELTVNELYNALLEDPLRLQAAAEVSIDILFAAFEKFLSKAWQERMGPLMTSDTLATMTSGLDSGKPSEFAKQVRRSLEDMSPQNRRAFSSAIKLLSDLLDCSGNDGDRGELMASFTEALIPSGRPHDYIALFDRLVDDFDSLFDGNELSSAGENPSIDASTGSLKHNRSNHTGSLSSNASSLKKRFGFGTLSRENSKSESESKVASMWRTLSKNTKSPGDSQQQPASLSKASLIRSRSTDRDPKMLPTLRSSAQDDRPGSNTSITASSSRPTSSHLNSSILTTIGENTPTKTPSVLRKKRRSSLSDLRPLQNTATATSWLPLQPRKLPQPGASGMTATPPRTPSENRGSYRHIPKTEYAQLFGSPERPISQRSQLPSRFGSPQQKENSPSPKQIVGNSTPPSIPRYTHNKPSTLGETAEVKITSLSPRKGAPLSSSIPAPRGGLKERAWPPNAIASTSPSKITQSSPQKLRMQSPQKLRERLSNEQKALNNAESSLQAEIAKIGEEMSVFKLSRPSTKRIPSPGSSSMTSSTPSASSIAALESRLTALSTSLSTLSSETQSRYSSLAKDVESSLLISERKNRHLDQLYREANAENEALYDRFNSELEKVLGRVRAGEGVEELRMRVKEGGEEGGRLRGENARLKREVVGLRSLVGG